ncbi:MAG: aminotransferase class V-fold PLP-dependent enzyme, partial [Burkholderiales bacterium]
HEEAIWPARLPLPNCAAGSAGRGRLGRGAGRRPRADARSLSENFVHGDWHEGRDYMGYDSVSQQRGPWMIDASLIEKEFPQQGDLVYLNHAAVAPWPARTAAAICAFADENVRSGASRYAEWVSKQQQLREQLRRLINAPSSADIALLKNTSEALSVVACGLDWRWGDNVVSTDEEFPSNRIPWQAQRKTGVGLKQVSIRGEEPEEALMQQCDARTRVLAVSSVQYASGIRLDLGRLGAFCRSRGILFCVDAIQSLGAFPVDVQAECIDFLMADGHKWMLGPEGIALFYCAEAQRFSLELRQFGWHMVENSSEFESQDWRPAATARRFECGSGNLLGSFGLSASVSLLEQIGIESISRTVLNTN